MSAVDYDAFLRANVLEHRYCATCGRQMVRRDELTSERDPATGDRVVEHWWECERYPRNSLTFMLRGFRNHDSLSLDAPLIGRSYR